MKTNRTILYLLVIGMITVWALWLGFSDVPQPEVYKVNVRGLETVEEIIKRIAIAKNYDDIDFALAIVECESGFNPDALGDGGKSRGLWQIYKPAWPEISDEQAYDPVWSTNWAIEKLKQNKSYLWTCARKLVKL